MRRIVLLLASMALAVVFGSGVTLADSPTTKADCKNGGYAKYGFKNQGQCIKAVNHAALQEKIAFSTVNDDVTAEALGIMNPDGTGRQLITPDDPTLLDHDSPVLSPDGSKIAFCANTADDNANHIYVANVDGSNARPVVTELAWSSSGPTWSPNGNEIAFVGAATGNSGPSIYIADANQTNVYHRITDGLPIGNGAPTWSSTNKIAFHSVEGGEGGVGQDYVLYTVNPDGSGLARVIPGSYDSDWSPDGSKLVYQVYRNSGSQVGLFIANADGSNERQLTTSNGSTEPSWSPDGSKISFRREGDIWTVNVDGSNLTNITNTGEARFEGSPDWGFVRP